MSNNKQIIEQLNQDIEKIKTQDYNNRQQYNKPIYFLSHLFDHTSCLRCGIYTCSCVDEYDRPLKYNSSLYGISLIHVTNLKETEILKLEDYIYKYSIVMTNKGLKYKNTDRLGYNAQYIDINDMSNLNHIEIVLNNFDLIIKTSIEIVKKALELELDRLKTREKKTKYLTTIVNLDRVLSNFE